MVSRRPVSCSGRHFAIIVFISVVMDGRVKCDSSPCSRPWGGRVYCDVGDHRRSIIVGVGVVGGEKKGHRKVSCGLFFPSKRSRLGRSVAYRRHLGPQSGRAMCLCVYFVTPVIPFSFFRSVRSRNILRGLRRISLRFLVRVGVFSKMSLDRQATNGVPSASLLPAVATAEVFAVPQAAASASISGVRRRAKTNNQLRCRKSPF